MQANLELEREELLKYMEASLDSNIKSLMNLAAQKQKSNTAQPKIIITTSGTLENAKSQ